jgi:hypothetical protein
VKTAKRRKIVTVLDRLEAEGIVKPMLARELREMHKLRAGIAGERESPDRNNLRSLLDAVLQPARKETRVARLRERAIAFEHAYLLRIDR